MTDGPHRYHFTDERPFLVETSEGAVRLGKGWLAITEEEYAENDKLRAERDEAQMKLTNFGSTVLYELRNKPHSEIELEHAADAWERDATMYRAEVARLTAALAAEESQSGRRLEVRDEGDEIMVANSRVFVSVDADEISYAILRDGEWKPGEHSIATNPFDAWREIAATLKGSTDDAQA